jgi:hypothetical protein
MVTELIMPLAAAGQDTAFIKNIQSMLAGHFGLQLKVKFIPCDLFSMCETEKSLVNAEAAIYFSPDVATAGLTQGSQWDLELICADNLSYATQKAGVQQLIYLMGSASAEDQQRLEIKRTLSSRGIAVEELIIPAVDLQASLKDSRKSSPQGNSRTVRSVQRFTLPEGKSAAWAAREYGNWLARCVHPLGRVETSSEGDMSFYGKGIRKPLLILSFSPKRSSSERMLYFITGGHLAKVEGARTGRMEFREMLGGKALIVAIHDYLPALPWKFYRTTQAVIHLWVMSGFGKYLKHFKSDESISYTITR